MSEHRATVEWQLEGDFRYEAYSRSHDIDFGGSVRLAGNAAASNIPKTVPAAPGADPEQQFVASLSSCHMLWFLHLASKAKVSVVRYVDEASGVLEKNAAGVPMMTRVTLKPAVSFSGTPPTTEEHARLHHEAHGKCFIANSVKTRIILEPRIA